MQVGFTLACSLIHKHVQQNFLWIAIAFPCRPEFQTAYQKRNNAKDTKLLTFWAGMTGYSKGNTFA